VEAPIISMDPKMYFQNSLLFFIPCSINIIIFFILFNHKYYIWLN
jgi:hypothetical protein